MARFYFTYGSEGQPFVGGWTEVEAEDRRKACSAFRAYHPDITEGILNCSDVYTQEEFMQSGMAEDNLGARCHEYISLKQAEKEFSYFEVLKERLLEKNAAVLNVDITSIVSGTEPIQTVPTETNDEKWEQISQECLRKAWNALKVKNAAELENVTIAKNLLYTAILAEFGGLLKDFSQVQKAKLAFKSGGDEQ